MMLLRRMKMLPVVFAVSFAAGVWVQSESTVAQSIAEGSQADSLEAAKTPEKAGASERESRPRLEDGIEVAPGDWPWWRGPSRTGTASPDQHPPTEFGENKNVLWSVDIAGRGYSSPIVCGQRVLLTTSNEESATQSVLCFDRDSGASLWSKEVHARGGMRKNNKSTLASSSPACDGEHIFVAFPNSGKLVATALTMGGEIAWQREVSSYVVHQGYGASPALYRDLVIIAADNKGGGSLVAFRRDNGQEVWRRERPKKPNYPTPTLLHAAGKDQLVLVGCDKVVSYSPLTGETIWEVEGATTECVTSTITDGQRIYTSGGYPENHMSSVYADGSNRLAWKNKNRLYVPSLVIKDGYLFGVLDAGIAMCWKADTGEEKWRKRLGGTFSSSPVLVGDKVYVTNEVGGFTIFRASPIGFELISKNQLGDQVLASPAICGGRIYHRVTDLDESGNRRERLYCIGE